MRTKSDKKVSIVTLGCSKNLVDSENIYTQLKANQFDVHHDNSEKADIVIVNTCGFIDSAKEESIDTILHFAEERRSGNLSKLYVSGCLSERYKDDLVKEIPEVDSFFGTRDASVLIKQLKADYKKELLGERIPATDNHFAYFKISEGCDRPCSFCAIPLMRGGHRSRPIEELVQEATNLAKRGVKELLIIAQDSTYYGLDIYKKRNLAELLKKLADVEGIEWVRLHYAFPTGFPMDVLEVMRGHPNICNYLDIPLQSGSSKMLKIMRRGTTREKTETLINTIRQQVPGIAIRSTLIAGHPGETESDFEETLDFVRKMRFERLGVFTYSHEEDTHSHSMDDNIPQDVKEARQSEIMEVQQAISMELNSKKVGQVLKVIIDREESGKFIGRTEFDSPEVDNEVIIDPGSQNLSKGEFVNVRVLEATEFDIYGEIE